MGTLLAGLMSLAVPMTGRILIALGFSVVTVSGVAVAWDALKSQMQTAAGSLPADIAQLLGLGGVWIALGSVIGACSFVVSLWGLTSATKLIGASSGS